jgi:hypothetical protein
MGLGSLEVASRTSFSAGTAELLFSHPDLAARTPEARYEVSADGQRFLLVESVGGGEPAKIWVVQNWHTEFRDRQ